MKKVLSILLMVLLTASFCLTGCKKSRQAGDDRPVVAAGLPPVAFLAGRIAGDTVQLKCLLPEGRTPHDYTPGPGELRSLGRAKLFFSTGMAFEKKVCRPFPALAVIDVGKKAVKFPLSDNHHHDHHAADKDHDEHEHHHHDGEEGHDPHIWLDCHNAAVIAQEIGAALTREFPQHAELYQKNLKALEKQLSELKTNARQTLAPWRGRAFFVYHPAFGYYARMTGLRQISVELDGREVSAAQLSKVVREAKKERVHTIFVQPQFNPTAARMLAKSIGGEVQELDPLAADVIANIHTMTQQLYRAFAAEKGGK